MQDIHRGKQTQAMHDYRNKINFANIVRSVVLPAAAVVLLSSQARAAQVQDPQEDAELQGPSAKQYATHIAVKYLNPQLKLQKMSVEMKAVPVTNVLWVGYEVNCLLDNQMWVQTGLIYFGGTYYLLHQLSSEGKAIYSPNGDVGRELPTGGTIGDGDRIKTSLEVNGGKVRLSLLDISNPAVKAEKIFDVGSANACVGKQQEEWGTYTGIAEESISYTMSITTPPVPAFGKQELRNTSELLPAQDDLSLGAKYFIPRTGKEVFVPDEIPKQTNRIGQFGIDVTPELFRVYRTTSEN